ncbi:MAG: nitrous oxide reductase accessory protein NosL [Ignavibacteria bacterium]|nr:nitrous oxide reductase accessory protein NosL [Ignavibacteria bacterium]
MSRTAFLLIALLVSSCSPREIEPVPIYEEDTCSFCRMSISEPRFAAEILSTSSEVYKFDDLGCLRSFRERRTDVVPAGVFVIDYDNGTWLPYHRAVVTVTGIRTPMASGLIATSSRARAAEIAEHHPPEDQ